MSPPAPSSPDPLVEALYTTRSVLRNRLRQYISDAIDGKLRGVLVADVVDAFDDRVRALVDAHVREALSAMRAEVESRRPLGTPPDREHLPGCGILRRGCMPGCWNYDPRYDVPPPSGEAGETRK